MEEEDSSVFEVTDQFSHFRAESATVCVVLCLLSLFFENLIASALTFRKIDFLLLCPRNPVSYQGPIFQFFARPVTKHTRLRLPMLFINIRRTVCSNHQPITETHTKTFSNRIGNTQHTNPRTRHLQVRVMIMRSSLSFIVIARYSRASTNPERSMYIFASLPWGCSR